MHGDHAGGLIAGQKGKVDDGYRAASEYLRLLGLNNTAEIGRILDIAMNPNSLFSASRDEKRRNALVCPCTLVSIGQFPIGRYSALWPKQDIGHLDPCKENWLFLSCGGAC